LGRLVLNHSTNIEGLIPILQKLALNINIKTITPAVISRARGRSSKLILRISVKTINGYKAIARKGKTAQEVFISTDLSKDELKKLFLMPKEINWPQLAEGYQVKFKSVTNFKKLREALDWSISIQKSAIIKVDVDPENEICEKNALLEKIIGS